MKQNIQYVSFAVVISKVKVYYILEWLELSSHWAISKWYFLLREIILFVLKYYSIWRPWCDGRYNLLGTENVDLFPSNHIGIALDNFLMFYDTHISGLLNSIEHTYSISWIYLEMPNRNITWVPERTWYSNVCK